MMFLIQSIITMQEISFYLEKFKNISPPHDAVKKAVARAIERLFGEVLHSEHISVRNNTVYITTHPALKSELYIRKGEVLQEIEQALIGSDLIKEVR